MLIKLQSTDPERLGKEEGSQRTFGLLWEGDNRRNFAGGLGNVGNRRQGVRCGEGMKESLGRDSWNCWAFRVGCGDQMQ